MKNPIIAALDVDDVSQASKLISQLQPWVGGFKIGPRLTLRAEKSFFRDLSQAGTFFFDHKFFDIPSTTVASVRIAADLGADWVTVHALNGTECLKALAREEIEIRKTNPHFKVLVVTVLTSFSKDSLPPIWKSQNISESVLELASSAHECGINSLVCSPEEIAPLKSKNEGSFLVVPGIRPLGSISDDQKRIATPVEALHSGASALVIGRPIIENADPAKVAREIFESLK